MPYISIRSKQKIALFVVTAVAAVGICLLPVYFSAMTDYNKCGKNKGSCSRIGVISQ